jgi:hypothetical protein
MNRRDALSRVALLVGGTVIGAEFFLSGCKANDEKYGSSVDFNEKDIAYLDEIAETIIPKTTTPGAKDAKVAAFMAIMVKDTYTKEQQDIFLKGMTTLNEASNKKFSNGFMQITPEQRKELLIEIDNEQKKYAKDKKKEDPPHYFTMMKQLTLLGYFTSEPGATQALNYVAIPGKYEACIPYNKGDKAYAL